MSSVAAEKRWLKNYDPHVPKTLEPYPDWSVADILTRAAESAPHTPATITSAVLPVVGRIGQTMTYAELKQRADALGAAFYDLGLQKGDRVALLMPNCPAFVVAWFATLGAGMDAVGLNPTYPPARLAEMMQDSGCKAIVTLSLFYNAICQIRAQTPLKQVIVTNIKEGFPPAAAFLFGIAKEKKGGHRVEIQPGDHALPDLLEKYAGQQPKSRPTKDDPAIFQYTGGTTGPSKAAVSNHSAIVANTLQQNAVLVGTEPSAPGVRMLAAIPFYHVFGMISVIATAATTRGTMIIIPNARDIDDMLDTITKYEPEIFHGVPALYNGINAHPEVASGKYKVSSIKHCLSGSAPLPRPTKETFEKLTGGKLTEGYGMSEAPTATHVNPLQGGGKVGSVGLPLPDTIAKIVDAADPNRELGVGEIGEIVVSGPQLMSHYHERPTETQNVIVQDETGRRWLLTGDLGYMDDDGYFYIVDRKKDMALIGGFNVYPNQVDQVLTAHPAVAEVAVGIIPHPEKVGQEALKAWVVIKPGMNVTQEELMEFAAQKLARYEIPSRYEFLDALPRTAVGKILRRELVQQEIARMEKLAQEK